MNCDKEEHNDYLSECVFCAIENAAKYERSRIIKLLEGQGCDCHNVYCGKLPAAVIQSLIALIKEENNG